MPIYWGDFLKDTMHLSTEEKGAYLLLIGHYWSTGGAVKNDKILIKNVCGLSFKKLKNVLEFFEEKDGFLHHYRIDSELSKALENQESQRKRTEAATAARRIKSTNVTPNVTNNVTLSPSPSPSPSVVDEETRTRFIGLSEKIQDIVNSPLPLNTQRVRQWWSWGASDTMIEETVSFVRSRMKDPPSTLKYFDKAIASAIKQSQEPAPEVKDGNFKNGIRKTKSERIDEACARAAKDLGVFAE